MSPRVKTSALCPSASLLASFEPHTFPPRLRTETTITAFHSQEPLALYGAEHAVILLDCNPSTSLHRYIDNYRPSMEAAVGGLSLVVIISNRIAANKHSEGGRINHRKRIGVGILIYGSNKLQIHGDDSCCCWWWRWPKCIYRR